MVNVQGYCKDSLQMCFDVSSILNKSIDIKHHEYFTHHKPRSLSADFLLGTEGNSNHKYISHINHFYTLKDYQSIQPF